ncbi:hypothetical protein D3C86_1619680 [compost metagenome]
MKEDILPAYGHLKIFYLREIGFPVDDVAAFRELMVHLFNFKLAQVVDNFSFAIGGTAHAVITSKKRKWIPIAMTALPPVMVVTFGVSSMEKIREVRAKLDAKGVPNEWREEGQLSFELETYRLKLKLSNMPEDLPSRLQLPFSRIQEN